MGEQKFLLGEQLLGMLVKTQIEFVRGEDQTPRGRTLLDRGMLVLHRPRPFQFLLEAVLLFLVLRPPAEVLLQPLEGLSLFFQQPHEALLPKDLLGHAQILFREFSLGQFVRQEASHPIVLRESILVKLLDGDVGELVIPSAWLFPLSFLDEIEKARCSLDGVTEDGKQPASSCGSEQGGCLVKQGAYYYIRKPGRCQVEFLGVGNSLVRGSIHINVRYLMGEV